MRPINHFPTIWAIRVTLLAIIVHITHAVVGIPVTPITIPSFTLLNYGLSIMTPAISFPWWADILLAGPVFGAVVMALFCVIWQISSVFESAGYDVLELDEYFIKETFIDLEKEGSVIFKITDTVMIFLFWISIVSLLYFIFNFLTLPLTEHFLVILGGPFVVYFSLSACFFLSSLFLIQ